jgi:hypothetical protein
MHENCLPPCGMLSTRLGMIPGGTTVAITATAPTCATQHAKPLPARLKAWLSDSREALPTKTPRRTTPAFLQGWRPLRSFARHAQIQVTTATLRNKRWLRQLTLFEA